MSEQVLVHPIQYKERFHFRDEGGPAAPQVVTLRAYEVYSAVFSPQPALITDGCRGGFSVGELVAFLYAHSFPPAEWRARVDEAFKGMRL